MMSYAVITLSGVFRETGNQIKSVAAAGANKGFRFDKFYLLTENILKKRKIDSILIDCKEDFRPSAFAGAEAVRSRLAELAGAGKTLYFYSKYYNPVRIYIASVCSKRLIHPLGSFSYFGIARSFLFFGKALDKHRINVEVIRRGKYKSAADLFRTDRLDPANKEQYGLFLRRASEELQEKICGAFKKEPAELEELINGRILSAEEAVEAGWIDEAAASSALLHDWKQEKKKCFSIKKLGSTAGRGKKIAVLVFEGAIIDGRSQQHPLFGQSIGSDSYIPVIDALAEKKSIKGVVFRVNSGGGSPTASEDILQALKRLQEKKPLVISMSEVAGSGGYWISAAGAKLFAHSTTLTGSIGVIGIFFQVRELLKKYGVTGDSLKEGPYADIGSAMRKMSAKERTVLEKNLDSMYQKFVAMCAGFRNKTISEIDSAAQGRIWAGKDALEQGLIDETGGLSSAVAYLKSLLKIDRCKIAFYPVIHYSFIEKKLMQASDGRTAAGVSDVPAAAVLKELLRNGFGSGQPLALMPESISSLKITE